MEAIVRQDRMGCLHITPEAAYRRAEVAAHNMKWHGTDEESVFLQGEGEIAEFLACHRRAKADIERGYTGRVRMPESEFENMVGYDFRFGSDGGRYG